MKKKYQSIIDSVVGFIVVALIGKLSEEKITPKLDYKQLSNYLSLYYYFYCVFCV